MLVVASAGIALAATVMLASVLRYRGYWVADRFCEVSGGCERPSLIAGGLIAGALALLLLRARSTASTIRTGGIIPR